MLNPTNIGTVSRAVAGRHVRGGVRGSMNRPFRGAVMLS